VSALIEIIFTIVHSGKAFLRPFESGPMQYPTHRRCGIMRLLVGDESSR
jgi:hypothetical protein